MPPRGPGCRNVVLRQVGSYLGYTGRAAIPFGKAARDPKRSSARRGRKCCSKSAATPAVVLTHSERQPVTRCGSAVPSYSITLSQARRHFGAVGRVLAAGSHSRTSGQYGAPGIGLALAGLMTSWDRATIAL